MKIKMKILLPWLIAGLLVFPACREERTGDTYESALAAFESPPAEFRTAPLWVWNDKMTEGLIKEQLIDFKARGIGGVFVHPRPGLVTPYLSDEWFSLFRTAVETGKELGLNVWIYDENSYPSGFAGGHVPAALPDAASSGLRLVRVEGVPEQGENRIAAVFLRTPTGYRDVTPIFNKNGSGGLESASYAVVEIVVSEPSAWYGGFTYVDLMRKDVTEKFLELTLDGYKKAVGAEFGLTVPGSFQDEAEIGPPGGKDIVNYSTELFAAFQRKWGYDLRPHLISLFETYGEWRRIRYNFYSTLLDLFIENWAKPYYAYCLENGLVFTGHYWEHEWPVPRVGPDNLAMAAYAQMPGIDVLMNQYGRGPHAQFGNARSVREIRSSANQFGRRRTLAETYGASGWDLNFADQKRIADWEFALGVNFLNQHLSYATIKGARKRDHPLSFSYHEPWWPLYNHLADYFARLAVVMSSGQQSSRILVIEPTTTAWMYYSPSGNNDKVREIAEDFQKFVNLLEENQIEYDLASEKTIQEFGSVKYRKLVVGSKPYELVVLPPGMENFSDSTMSLLREYMLHHGRILSWVAPPDYINGIITGDVREIQRSYGDRWLDSGPHGFEKLRDFQKREIWFEEPSANDWLFHQRRRFDGGQFILLVNTNLERPARGKVSVRNGSAERWDAMSGKHEPYPFERRGDMMVLDYDIPPAGSLLLCLRNDENEIPAVPRAREKAQEVEPASGPVISRLKDNVLTLDYCDLVLAGRTYRDFYFYQAQKNVFRQHGFEGNPWDSGIQYKTSIIDRDAFPAGSGFEAQFNFRALKSDAYDFSSLKAVVERPILFEVTINGRKVEPAGGEWWLDRDFGVYHIGSYVVSGLNRLTVRVRPFSVYAELEPVYLLGDFSLEPAAKGFVLRPAGEVGLGAWDEQGMPFYGQTVSYEADFIIEESSESWRYRLELDSWNGSVAGVLVNGQEAGIIAFPPFELEVTGLLKSGRNTVSVIVYGTLRNTLGPFHGGQPPGSAWPASFQKAPESGQPPGKAYKAVKYGLFKDFRLVKFTI